MSTIINYLITSTQKKTIAAISKSENAIIACLKGELSTPQNIT